MKVEISWEKKEEEEGRKKNYISQLHPISRTEKRKKGKTKKNEEEDEDGVSIGKGEEGGGCSNVSVGCVGSTFKRSLFLFFRKRSEEMIFFFFHL